MSEPPSIDLIRTRMAEEKAFHEHQAERLNEARKRMDDHPDRVPFIPGRFAQERVGLVDGIQGRANYDSIYRRRGAGDRRHSKWSTSTPAASILMRQPTRFHIGTAWRN